MNRGRLPKSLCPLFYPLLHLRWTRCVVTNMIGLKAQLPYSSFVSFILFNLFEIGSPKGKSFWVDGLALLGRFNDLGNLKGQLLTELNPFLVKRVDVPNEPLKDH